MSAWSRCDGYVHRQRNGIEFELDIGGAYFIRVDVHAHSFTVEYESQSLDQNAGVASFSYGLADLDWVGDPSAIITNVMELPGGTTPAAISIAFDDHALTLVTPASPSSPARP